MLDSHGRNIDYMRISITDRCNLRCKYCMPEDPEFISHCEILRYEEILRLCRVAVSLGIVNFKITGGEPLIRSGCTDFIKDLKNTEGVEEVTITTNGILLKDKLDALIDAGIDAVTVSIDSLDDGLYREISGYKLDAVNMLMECLDRCAEAGVRTKINTVLLNENLPEITALARLAEKPIDVRFIEMMPIGFGANMERVKPDDILETLKKEWPDLRPTDERRGNGPAHHYKSDALKGRIGFIDAVSHKFCSSCNRIRLTSTGLLKPCLSYELNTDMRELVRGGASDDELREAMRAAIERKPTGHCFESVEEISEHKTMSQIGG